MLWLDGRAGAAGYLRRVTKELGARGLETTAAASAAEHMQASSDLFKVLRYEADLPKAGAVLPEDVAAVVVMLLSDYAAYMTGQAINVTGGAYMD